jgi:hypothetical protein
MVAAAGAVVPAAGQTESPVAVSLVIGPMSWEGEATVYPPGRELKIAVRTRIDQLGNVVSESWPIELGEAKGLRRMTLTGGGGTVERDGQKLPMPEDMYREERAQFEIYRLLQLAADRGPEMAALGADTFSVLDGKSTWFRIDKRGTIVGAVNEVPAEGGAAYQQFRFEGFLTSGEWVFPKHMEMTREGKPYFTLDVAKFNAR